MLVVGNAVRGECEQSVVRRALDATRRFSAC
jgi:hypothetical protein